MSAYDARRRLIHLYTSNQATEPSPIAHAVPSCAKEGEVIRKKSLKSGT